jgi:predicted acylesterase/phospholipase RssA
MRAVVLSGHVTDEPGRAVRFPPSTVTRVRAEIARQLSRWSIGPGDLVITGGARGADLIGAEEALRRGALVHLYLALPRDEFLARSVDAGEGDWRSRFLAVESRAHLDELDVGPSTRRFEKANEWMIDVLTELDVEPEGKYALIVWDGMASAGHGGASHMAKLAATRRIPMYTIDPSPRPSADRQWAARPKKLLALDGGGIRGILALEILKEIEAQLRHIHDDATVVLANYFDYIAGTSTGAIIATALSLGYSVDELVKRYRSLGDKVFKRNWLRPIVSLHPSGPLTSELEQLIGSRTTLGDPRLQTLLLLVLHDRSTDSPWLVSNCPSARYNRPERALTVHPERGGRHVPDRNLDLSLVDLVRGSTAAPMYFAPERILVGNRTRTFQDGGVTPYNNPALLLASMATQPEYEVCWPDGADQLLIVSVGTGLAPVQAPARTNMLTNVLTLPGIIMNGASIGQDYLCRAAGVTRFGPHVDNEVGRVPIGSGHFSYVRYNAALNGDGEFLADLERAGATDSEVGEVERITRIGAKKLGKLNSTKRVEDLQRLGQITARTVAVDPHFAGFL